MPRRAAAVRPGGRAAPYPARATGRLWSYCWGMLVAPRRTAEAINATATAGDGVAMASLFGGLYAVAALTSYLARRQPSGRTLKMIPAERYYLWQSGFTLPLTLLQFALNAAVARQVSRRLGGSGRFGPDFTMLAFTQAMPLLAAMWLPDMACYLMWGRRVGSLRVDGRLYARLVAVYAPAATAWAVALSARGLSVSERIRWPVALPAVIASEAASAVASGVAVAMR